MGVIGKSNPLWRLGPWLVRVRIAMNVKHSHTSDGWTCIYCGERFEPPASNIDESCCSDRCAIKREGSKLLNLLRHDHTICANCGTKFKSVEEPTDESLKHISGYHSTEAVVATNTPKRKLIPARSLFFQTRVKNGLYQASYAGIVGMRRPKVHSPRFKNGFY